MRLWKSAASPLVFPVGLVRLGAVWSGYRPPQAALSGSGVEAGVPTSSIRAPLYLEVFRGPTPGYPYTPHRHRRCTWRSPMICKDAITRRSRSVAVRPFRHLHQRASVQAVAFRTLRRAGADLGCHHVPSGGVRGNGLNLAWKLPILCFRRVARGIYHSAVPPAMRGLAAVAQRGCEQAARRVLHGHRP